VTSDLRGALTPVETKNRAAITDSKRIGELLRSIEGYSGQPSTHAALRLALLTFVRPGGFPPLSGPSSTWTMLSGEFPRTE
jgi:hypothetical protein